MSLVVGPSAVYCPRPILEMIRYVKSVDALETRADLRQRESDPPEGVRIRSPDTDDFQV